MSEKEYTREAIISGCKRNLQNAGTFYQADFINYRGKTTDTNELFNEVVCEFVCDHIDSFKNSIPKITRKQSYHTDSHTGNYSPNSNREEEITAIKMYNQSKNGYCYDHIGKIIDYQTPLKTCRHDSAGKVDLLSYDGKVLRFLELKKRDSTETMLRSVLEGYTYLKTANTEKLLSDFQLPPDTIVKASPFVFSGSEQHKEFLENRPQLKRLMTLLDSKPFFIKENNNFYTVED